MGLLACPSQLTYCVEVPLNTIQIIQQTDILVISLFSMMSYACDLLKAHSAVPNRSVHMQLMMSSVDL